MGHGHEWRDRAYEFGSATLNFRECKRGRNPRQRYTFRPGHFGGQHSIQLSYGCIRI